MCSRFYREQSGILRLCMWLETVFSLEKVKTCDIFILIMGFYLSVLGR